MNEFNKKTKDTKNNMIQRLFENHLLQTVLILLLFHLL